MNKVENKLELKGRYTQIPDTIIEKLCTFNMPSYPMRVFLFMIRKTFGFRKRADRISRSQICEGTGIVPRNVSKAITWLFDNGFIDISKPNKKGRCLAATNMYSIRYISNWKISVKCIPTDALKDVSLEMHTTNSIDVGVQTTPTHIDIISEKKLSTPLVVEAKASTPLDTSWELTYDTPEEQKEHEVYLEEKWHKAEIAYLDICKEKHWGSECEQRYLNIALKNKEEYNNYICKTKLTRITGSAKKN